MNPQGKGKITADTIIPFQITVDEALGLAAILAICNDCSPYADHREIARNLLAKLKDPLESLFRENAK
jgi:hypothetical protein